MKSFPKARRLIFFWLFPCLLACQKKPDQPLLDPVYSEAMAREISFVTSGEIQQSDLIQVIFNQSMVEDDRVNSSPPDVFTFSPKIAGKAVWTSPQILTFQPEGDLPTRTVITGTLQMQKLDPRYKEEQLEDLVFQFKVLGREISSFKGTVTLKDRNDPAIVYYSGSLSFSEKTSLENLKKATQIQGNKDITLTWSQVDERNFQFATGDIVRSEKEQQLSLLISKKPLDLEDDFSEGFTIYPIKNMSPTAFIADESGKSPRIRINFSDELDIDQTLDGLIRVTPAVDYEAKKLGSTVILDGGFKFGETYTLTVMKGIGNRWGNKTEKETRHKLTFANIPPQLEFGADGIILPTSNKKKIQFYTTNLSRVHLEVKKVYTSHIGKFAQTSQLHSTKNRNKDFSDQYTGSVGVIVKNQTLELKAPKNQWVLQEFDLSDLFETYDDGLFLVRVNFTPEDAAVPILGDLLPHIQEKGQIYKPVFLSDLAITVKAADKQNRVFVTDIVTGKPKAGVKVTLLDYNGEAKQSGTTDRQGTTVFTSNQYFYYVMAESGKQTTLLNRSEMRWSSSGFDVGGVGEYGNGTKGFIYTERGVYRPGDSVHVSLMVKNANNTFPTDHPVSITVNDPQYNPIYEHTTVKGTDGLYVFGFKTADNAPTGNYNIYINAGGSHFYQDLKIETVVAEQLKVQVKPTKRQLTRTDLTVDFDLNVNYLFGAPAAELKAEVDIEIHPYTVKFPAFPTYSFTRADLEFNSITQQVMKGDLDHDGNLSGSWTIPALGTVPSALKGKLIAKVLDKTGQPNEGWNVVDINPYDRYVGISDPSGYGYFKTNEEAKFPVILLDLQGKKVSGRQLTYRIYRNDKMWWYQYDNRRTYQLKYKEDSQTYFETEGTVDVQNGTAFVPFTPGENGEYLIEVSDGSTGHSSSFFFSAYPYGSVPGGDLNEGTLALKSDKSTYSSQETAKIKLPNPRHGNVLVTLEKGRQMLNWFWVDPSSEDGDELILDIPLDKSMLPNVYVTVSVIQPHDQTVNDRPIRMFGIIPIMLEDPDTKIQFNLAVKETLAPNEPFEVRVSTANQKKAQFTIAVVDEGLLSLTQFPTPSPWNEFYKKVGLYVESFDVFSHVISANKADVFQTFSIGGADGLDYRESQLDPVNGQQRFIPVSMFSGPITTDDQGKATVKFNMPNYNGAVRIMVVGTQQASFGHAEKTVPVKSDLIMQPGIPRTLKPGDEFLLPVALFRTNPTISTANFTLRTTGPLEIIGNAASSVNFSQRDEAAISFKVRVKEAAGPAQINLSAEAGAFSAKSTTNIQVVPASPRIYDQQTQKLNKTSPLSLQIPAIGLTGTNTAQLTLSIFPDMDFDHRIKWLIDYPYGCLEQVTSAVFPQLFLKKMGYFAGSDASEIDKNINAGILKLQQFNLPDGGFSYWPGESDESEWGTNYAVHFLVEAKKMGYSIPEYLYNGAIEWLKSGARQHGGKLTTRVNRAFILALAGEQPVAEMNLLLENELNNMDRTEKTMLAAAYHLAGAGNVRDRILSSSMTVTKTYEPFSYDFASVHRDDAIRLYAATLMDQMGQAELLAKSIASTLSSKEYLSTQSAGYMLLALGKYFDAAGITTSGSQIIRGSVTLANGRKLDFNEKGKVTLPIRENFNQTIQVSLSNNSAVEEVYASLSWSGVPLKDVRPAIQQNLSLEVSWHDESGKGINPASLQQGQTIYGKFRAKNTGPASSVTEIALTQLLPSGWQIENTRINNTLLPDWTNSLNLNKEDYLDIRDDRAMWFFDLTGPETKEFILKINAVSAGDFWLPGTLLEAMYNNDYKAKTDGRKVHVEAFK
ncbi:MAG TPA: MG2 domain-containing protein [Lunatimonas sp.]|nr:MG2 domain-containing protein [Lunatimonas sp.]